MTPTVISVLKKSTEISVFYSFSEEEQVNKQMNVIFHNTISEIIGMPNLYSGPILSENLSKHDTISSSIFIPPPELV